MQCSDVAWHPDVATQLVLSSENDQAPVVQLWDLRFAASPMKVNPVKYTRKTLLCYTILIFMLITLHDNCILMISQSHFPKCDFKFQVTLKSFI